MKRPLSTCARCSGPCAYRHHYCEACRVEVARVRKEAWNRTLAERRRKLRAEQQAMEQAPDYMAGIEVGKLALRLQRVSPDRMEEAIEEMIRGGRDEGN